MRWLKIKKKFHFCKLLSDILPFPMTNTLIQHQSSKIIYIALRMHDTVASRVSANNAFNWYLRVMAIMIPCASVTRLKYLRKSQIINNGKRLYGQKS